MKRALKQLCQEGSVRGGWKVSVGSMEHKRQQSCGRRWKGCGGGGEGGGVGVKYIFANDCLNHDPLDLVQRGCDRNNQRGGKKVEEQPSWGMTDIFPSSSLIGIVRKKATTVFSSLGIRSINTQRTIVLS